MKRILLFSLISMTFSCNFINKTPTEKLKDDAENMLKSRLHDPSSYEFVSFAIDTFNRPSINQRMKDINDLLVVYKKDSIKNKLLILKCYDEIEAATKVQKPDNQIEFLLEYRTKNKLGALNLGSAKIVSDKSYNLLNVSENE